MTPKERRRIVNDFFNKAEAKNLIVYKDFLKFPEFTKHILRNRKEETDTFRDFNDIFQDPKKLITLEQFIFKKFGIENVSTIRLMSNYFIFHALNYLEAIKMILKEYIDPTKKIGERGKRITEDTTLNQLVISLAQETHLPDFEKLFPKHFRNILGHSALYFKNNEFCYFDENKNEISLTQEEFVDLMNETDVNFLAITDEWARRKSKHNW